MTKRKTRNYAKIFRTTLDTCNFGCVIFNRIHRCFKHFKDQHSRCFKWWRCKAISEEVQVLRRCMCGIIDGLRLWGSMEQNQRWSAKTFWQLEKLFETMESNTGSCVSMRNTGKYSGNLLCTVYSRSPFFFAICRCRLKESIAIYKIMETFIIQISEENDEAAEAITRYYNQKCQNIEYFPVWKWLGF